MPTVRANGRNRLFRVFWNKSPGWLSAGTNWGVDEGSGNSGSLLKNETQDYNSSKMAREVLIGSRRFYIVSEPDGQGWRAQVLEIIDGEGSTKDMGIETTGETRTLTDDRALGVLQHRLREE